MTADIYSNMRLGRYELRDRIGKGGMARVFRAYDTNLDRLVAIKMLHEHLSEEPTFRQRFEREAKFIASFNHPNIVQVYDFDVYETPTDCLYYMVMPYIPGKTLKDILENAAENGERLSNERVLEIMQGICDALGYAHDRGMVHRDVKPGNILFNERQQAVLTDFGIARMIESSHLTQEGMTTGTPAYMSPEQVSGLPVDARSDLYALGIILFEMLTGQLPFTDDSNISTMLKHVNEPVPSLSEYLDEPNPALDAFIQRAMAKAPEDRFQFADEFADHLQAAMTGVPLPPPRIRTETGIHTTAAYADTITPTPAGNSITMTINKVRQSPLGILAIGLAVIAFITALALLTRMMSDSDGVGTDAVASMTGDMFFTSDFTPDSPLNVYWPQDNTPQFQREITPDGFFRFTNLRPNTAITSLFEPEYTYEDVTISMSGVLAEASPRSSAYGIIFRYIDSENYNVFAVDGAGRFSIWVLEDEEWRELRDVGESWTEHAAVRPRGEINRLDIEINDDRIAGFVNGMQVVELEEDSFDEGAVGIYLATTNVGTATVLVDMYQTEEFSMNSVPSMTGNQ